MAGSSTVSNSQMNHALCHSNAGRQSYELEALHIYLNNFKISSL